MYTYVFELHYLQKKFVNNVLSRELELIDPTPNIYALFDVGLASRFFLYANEQLFNKEFFYDSLVNIPVKWSKRMTLCAGICRQVFRRIHDIAYIVQNERNSHLYQPIRTFTLPSPTFRYSEYSLGMSFAVVVCSFIARDDPRLFICNSKLL